MKDYKEYLVSKKLDLRRALEKLDNLAEDAILFLVDEDQKLVGSLTDGDVRRGIIKGHDLNQGLGEFCQTEPKFLRKGDFDINEVVKLRKDLYKIVPVLDENGVVCNVINFRDQKSYLPLDALIMAGGLGTRLKPLTNQTPKPLLKVGNKAIIDYNVERLRKFGIDKFHISIRHLGDQIVEHFDTMKVSNCTF